MTTTAASPGTMKGHGVGRWFMSAVCSRSYYSCVDCVDDEDYNLECKPHTHIYFFRFGLW